MEERSIGDDVSAKTALRRVVDFVFECRIYERLAEVNQGDLLGPHRDHFIDDAAVKLHWHVALEAVVGFPGTHHAGVVAQVGGLDANLWVAQLEDRIRGFNTSFCSRA